MPNTTTDQIIDAYEDSCMDIPGYEGTWDAFYELCELGERIIKRGRDIERWKVECDA